MQKPVGIHTNLDFVQVQNRMIQTVLLLEVIHMSPDSGQEMSKKTEELTEENHRSLVKRLVLSKKIERLLLVLHKNSETHWKLEGQSRTEEKTEENRMNPEMILLKVKSKNFEVQIGEIHKNPVKKRKRGHCRSLMMTRQRTGVSHKNPEMKRMVPNRKIQMKMGLSRRNWKRMVLNRKTQMKMGLSRRSWKRMEPSKTTPMTVVLTEESHRSPVRGQNRKIQMTVAPTAGSHRNLEKEQSKKIQMMMVQSRMILTKKPVLSKKIQMRRRMGLSRTS